MKPSHVYACKAPMFTLTASVSRLMAASQTQSRDDGAFRKTMWTTEGSRSFLPRPLCPTVTAALHFRSSRSTNTPARGWKERTHARRHAGTLHRAPAVKCGGHLQWINTADRSGSLCLESAIGTHSWPVETEAWSQDCRRWLLLDKQGSHGSGGLPSPEGRAPSQELLKAAASRLQVRLRAARHLGLRFACGAMQPCWGEGES